MAELKVKAVVVGAFEPDSGPVPGELHHFLEREELGAVLALPSGYRPLRWNRETGVLALVAGVGAVRAAASAMALGLDPRFDLTEALWLITGVAGIDPERGSLGSVVLPEYVVDGNFAHELDAREIPASWPDGFVPIGKVAPYEQPLAHRFNGDDGIVFRLDSDRVAWARTTAAAIALKDSEQMAARRMQFEGAAAQQPPGVLPGEELAATTFFHGRLLSQRARRWVSYQTGGAATYAITAMEDSGILQSLSFLAAVGRVDRRRIVIARGVSNFDRQRPGITAAESLAETGVASYSAYRPALENAWRVGHVLLENWLLRS